MAHSADPSLYEQTIEAQTAIAICSFTRQSETELSFTVNDLLEIWVEDAGSGWVSRTYISSQTQAHIACCRASASISHLVLRMRKAL